ncbi:MAG: hypothetical protein WCV90_03030 [Candidatus Woesearchaeota archaeon]
MKRLFLLIIILCLIVGSYAQEESYFNLDNPNQDSSSSAIVDQYLQEQQKLEQLRGFGIDIEPNALGGVIIEGDTISISGQTFNFNGATLSGGNVVIKNGELVSAQNVQADSFKYQGANVDGTFSVNENTLTIEEGNLELGSESSSTLKVLANPGTNIDVSKDKGYTGTIQSSGNIALTLKDQSIPVSGKVELVEGKIKAAEKVEVKEPSKDLFSNLPLNLVGEETKVSMAEGKVSEGNVFDTPELCLDASCVLSEQEPINTQVTPAETTYTSEAEVTYTQEKEVDKIWDSPEEVSKQEDASWVLSPGTEFTEWQGTEPDLTATVSEEIAYLPPEMPDQSSCPPGMSCINYADPDQLEMQSVTTDQTNVDLWDPDRFLQTDLNTEEGSASTLNAHDTSKEGEGILQFQASDDELEVYPASELSNFFTEDPTSMVSERELSSTTDDGQTIQVDASEIKLLDEKGETVGTVADPFDTREVQDAYTENGYFNFETGEYGDNAVASSGEEEYVNRLTGMRERGEISTLTAGYLINTPNLNLDDPAVMAKIKQLDQIGQIDPEQARNLKEIYSQYGQGSDSQKDEAVLEDLISLNSGKEDLGSTLNLPPSLPRKELPKFLTAMDVLNKNGIFNPVAVSLELWQKGVPDILGDKPLANYFSASSSGSENKKGIARLQEMQKLADDESLSPQAEDALRQNLQNTGLKIVGRELDYLHDKDASQRQTLAQSLPVDVAVGVLSQSTGGLGYDLYRSSEELVYRGLVQKAGGAENLVPYLESKGYGLETKKGKGVISMLAAAGQLAKVLPKDPAKRKEVYQTAITSIDTPADGFETSRTILNNPTTREEYSQALLEQYQKVQEDPKSPEEEARRDLIQYTVRMNQDKFDQNNPTVKTILDTPSEVVLTQEHKLNLPSQQWIDQSPKEDNIPVLSSLVYFTSTEDPNEKVIYNGFSGAGEGFKVKERLPNGKGYVLEKKGILNGQPVTYRTIVTNDASVAANTKASTPLIAEFSRGHSYDADKAWNTPADKQGNMPKFGFVGSCAGSSSVIGKDLTTENPDTAFFATAGVGVGNLNNAYFNAFYRSIDNCKDYVCVEKTMKLAGGRGEYADNYAGPAKFNAQAFSSKNYVDKPKYAKTPSEENPPLIVSTAPQGTIGGPG